MMMMSGFWLLGFGGLVLRRERKGGGKGRRKEGRKGGMSQLYISRLVSIAKL